MPAPPTPTANTRRVRGIAHSRPIVYGSVATRLKTPPVGNPEHTHRWTVALHCPVSAPTSSFLTPLVQKVAFHLHDTYDSPRREVIEPPYEVSETGWGEFDIGIQVFFHPELIEKPVMFYHRLRLHPDPVALKAASEDAVSASEAAAASNTVNFWFLDDIMFVDPAEPIHHLLTVTHPFALPPRADPITFTCPGGQVRWQAWSLDSAQVEVDMLRRVLADVERQCSIYKADIPRLKGELDALKSEVVVKTEAGQESVQVS